MRWGLAALAPAAAALPISRRSWGESLRFAMLQPPRFGIATSILVHLTKSGVDATPLQRQLSVPAMPMSPNFCAFGNACSGSVPGRRDQNSEGGRYRKYLLMISKVCMGLWDSGRIQRARLAG